MSIMYDDDDDDDDDDNYDDDANHSQVLISFHLFVFDDQQ